MKKITLFISLLLILVSVLSPSIVYAQESEDYSEYDSFVYLDDFATANPTRVAGTSGEIAAASYLAGFFNSCGLSTSYQRFSFTNSKSQIVSSQNVIGVKYAATPTNNQVIIGAHYDNVGLGEGAFDNGSGIAVLMNLIDKLSLIDLDYNIIFIAFGAEEEGLYGSSYYVSQMLESDKLNTKCMINMDCVSAGDNLYIYCEDIKTDYCDFFVENSEEVNYGESITEKSYSKDIFLIAGYGGYPYYQTAQASDHSSFREVGIPTVFFYSGSYTFWSTTYVESEAQSSIMHTSEDTIDSAIEKYGISMAKKMETVSDTIFKTLTNEDFSDIISSAREEMVDEFWLASWLPCLIALLMLVVFILFAIHYRNKLDKMNILGVAQAKQETFFEATSSDDIFKL